MRTKIDKPLLVSIVALFTFLGTGCGQGRESWGDLRTLECTRTSGDRWICHSNSSPNETGQSDTWQCSFPNGAIDFNLDCSNVTKELERLRTTSP